MRAHRAHPPGGFVIPTGGWGSPLVNSQRVQRSKRRSAPQAGSTELDRLSSFIKPVYVCLRHGSSNAQAWVQWGC